MAAYASTTTLDTSGKERISRNFGMVIGVCDVTNYNTTGVEITAITKYFQTIKRVITDGFSTNGYIVRWNTTDKCFHAFYPSKALAAHAHDFRVIGGTAAAATDTLNVKALVLGKEEAADKVVAGADEATKGGVVSGDAVTAQAGTEVADDVNVGEVNFLALGLL